MILIMTSNTVRHFSQCSECKEMFRARLSLRPRARNRLVLRANGFSACAENDETE